MLNKLMNKLNPTFENLEKELLGPDFKPDNAKKMLDSKKIDINTQNNNGDTLLHTCIKKNKFVQAIWLINNGIKANIVNKDGTSDLVLAVERGDRLLATTLFTKHKDKLNVKSNGRTLLQDAVMSGQTKIVDYLLKTDIDINSQDNLKRSVIFDAIAFGDQETIEKIIELKDLNLNIQDINGKTILHDQKIQNNDELAKELIRKGADPTICDEKGNNYLTYTALRGAEAEEILDIAIESGLDLNKKIVDDLTIVMEVILEFSKTKHNDKPRRSALKKVAKKLINNKADVNSKKYNGETVLFDMIKYDDFEGATFLLENGANVNIQNNNSETPLLISVIKGLEYFDLTMLFVKYGANPTLKDNNGKTVPEILNEIILHVDEIKKLKDIELEKKINIEDDYRRILKQLLSLQFNYGYNDSTGRPLFYAPFYNGDMKTSQLYAQNGFDINTLNKDNLNLFYEYVDYTFEQGEDVTNFKDRLIYLIVNKSNPMIKNPSGQTVFMKVALIPNCNLKLFSKLKSVVKYNYKTKDNMGRTIMHACITSDNIELLKLIFGIDRDVQNIPDSLNMLPITYAALFGKKDMVVEFLKRDSMLKASKPIHMIAKKKFKPLLANLKKLTEGIKDPDLLKKIKTLQEEVVKDIAS
ncbi:MAG: ankyrin repeat domain-containing protein [Campylobacterota bacterium]|nr:ankyrin repeat domain-containing protein [Campylobacterota bacterium]